MQIRLNDHQGTPYYRQLADQIRFLVAAGRLEQGARLPSVRKLAEQLLINPNTVARAYRELETDGVVQTRRGAGVFVAAAESPLSERERSRILEEQIDSLWVAARQLGVDADTLLERVRQRGRQFQQGEGK